MTRSPAALFGCLAIGLTLTSPASASPGKAVCDVRSVEMTWHACQPTGVLVRGACADVTADSSDFLDSPRLGYLYFQCPADPGTASAGGCPAFGQTVAAANDANHCVDFFVSTLHSESTPLPPPEPPEVPITWLGCPTLKGFVADAGEADLGGIDYRAVPDGCGPDASAAEGGEGGEAGEGDEGGVHAEKRDGGAPPDLSDGDSGMIPCDVGPGLGTARGRPSLLACLATIAAVARLRRRRPRSAAERTPI